MTPFLLSSLPSLRARALGLALAALCWLGRPPSHRLEVHDYEQPRRVHPLRGTAGLGVLAPQTPLSIALLPTRSGAPLPARVAVRGFLVRGGQATPLRVEPERRADGALLWQAPAAALVPLGPGPVRLVLLVGRPGLVPRTLLPAAATPWLQRYAQDLLLAP